MQPQLKKLFDKAAELDDTFQELMTEVQHISLTDEEMDAARDRDFPETPAERAILGPEKMEKEPAASTEEDDVAQEG